MAQPTMASYLGAVNVDVPGVLVGHWSDQEARTGCTVVLLPDATVCSGEVRGGAPATREFELLDPRRLVAHVNAVVLSGGSAFGLASCEGVVDWCVEHDRGFATDAGVVPIVVGMSLFDLLVGDGSVRPGAAQGRLAAEAAAATFATGPVGAGTGATAGKWRGRELGYDAGFGAVTVTRGDLVVQAYVAANPAGDIDDGVAAQQIASGTFDWPVDPDQAAGDDSGEGGAGASGAFANTTLGVIVTNAALDKGQCRLVAEGGHDGFARALFPPHRLVDGDAIVAAATGTIEAPVDVVRTMGVVAVEQAIRSLRP